MIKYNKIYKNNNYLIMDSTALIKDYKISNNNKYFRIRAYIEGSKLIHASGFHSDYAEYSLKIETDYAKWTLKKRYDEFSKLNSKLIVRIPEMKKMFPPKRLFKSTDELISERIKAFTKYFNYLFDNINIFLIDELLSFISLKREIVLLFIKKYNMLNISEEDEVLISLKDAYKKLGELEEKKVQNSRRNQNNDEILNIIENEKNYYNSILKYEKKRQISFNWDEPPDQTPNLFVIKEFLNNLSEKTENKTKIIQTFEIFFKNEGKWIRLSSKEINFLYLGGEGEDEETKEYLSKTSYESKKRKKISSDYKYHSSFEFIGLDDDLFNYKENDDNYSNNNNINGLFYIIGNYEKNIILSIGVLDLLIKLIDTEINPDAEIYINIFKSLEIENYKMLNLNKIVKLNIGGDKSNFKAMKLLKLIFYDKNRDEYKRIIMEDDTVYKQYINYLNKFIE
jgi:hypothetical protein